MESKRAIIAVVLSLLVLIAWTQLYSPKNENKEVAKEATQQRKEEVKTEKQDEEKTVKEVKNSRDTEISAEKEQKIENDKDKANAKNIEILNKVGVYTVSEIGGKLISMKILGMKETNKEDSPLKELVNVEENEGTLEFISREKSIKGLQGAVYKAQTNETKIDATSEEKTLVLIWKSNQNIEIEKVYTIKPDSFLFDLQINIVNKSETTIDDNLGLVQWTRSSTEGGGRYAFRGLGAYLDNSLKEVDLGDIEENKGVLAGKISWGGYENSYFLKAILPMDAEGQEKAGSLKAVLIKNDQEGKSQKIKITYLANPEKIKPGEKVTQYYKVYYGPKKISLLNKAGYHLDKSINMGWLDIIAKPFLYFLNYTNDLVGNFGVAIIILTIVVKIIFWPLTQKSYKSMKAMQSLQPQMMKLKEKFKGDKQRLNQEMMGLYKAHKVNPMGGCLPMIIQIPVFIALYRLLDYAIELRHTPFFFWIQDLSAPDRLFRFPFSIPLMEPPYGIPVLTLLMGASMFITQKMTPTPGDPTQAKIMLLMPIVFTFIFINFPSGLVLYWLTQNILSIGQQYWVNKKR